MKEHFNVIDFLKQNTDFNEIDEISDLLGQKVHYYGEHFKSPQNSSNYTFKNRVSDYLKLCYAILGSLTNRNKPLTVLSSSYFDVNKEIGKLGFSVQRPPWSIKLGDPIAGGFKFIFKTFTLKSRIRKLKFNELLDNDFLTLCSEFDALLKEWLIQSNVSAIIVPNDVAFFEKRLIKLSKECNIPSFVFLHGLPGRYNLIDDNRTDYLIVWGRKIKEFYINAGFDSNKILVSGHPNYTSRENFNSPTISFENILILTKSLNGTHHSDGTILGDRGNLILYLLTVEKVLKKFGVKQVRFRPHPSENVNWYREYLNKDFFSPDTDELKESLLKSTLIIGPTSTIFLESIYLGKSYIVYELSRNGKDVLNQDLVAPFDGSEVDVPVATSEDELYDLIHNRSIVNQNVLNDYLNPTFDLTFSKYFKKSD